MDRDNMPTYYPGDMVRLNLEFRHRANFRDIKARLAVRPEWEGAAPFHRDVTEGGLTTEVTATDGSKVRRVTFEFDIGNISSTPLILRQ